VCSCFMAYCYPEFVVGTPVAAMWFAAIVCWVSWLSVRIVRDPLGIYGATLWLQIVPG
jgi:hypothetical protein